MRLISLGKLFWLSWISILKVGCVQRDDKMSKGLKLVELVMRTALPMATARRRVLSSVAMFTIAPPAATDSTTSFWLELIIFTSIQENVMQSTMQR